MKQRAQYDVTLRMMLIWLLTCTAPTFSACVTLPRERFTALEQASATPVGFSKVRWVDGDPELVDDLRTVLRPGPDGVLNILAISGGGANGAYGAGVITAWTHRGDRPQFQLVTGISTGALSAPFAFLGPNWDAKLSEAYLGGGLQHLLQRRGPLGVLTPGFYRKRPLERMVAGYVSDDLLAAIAGEYAKGRLLLVATTDLDTEQLVIWNMGAIAAHGGPVARKLFADVLVASASVPIVFPPSLIAVESGGRVFNELHVDGQTEGAFIGVPQTLLLHPASGTPAFQIKIYLIINGSLDPTFVETPRSTVAILSRTLDVANRAALRSLLIENAEFCRANGCELAVTSLPPEQRDDSLDFSAGHIRDLLASGTAAIETGHVWRTGPPEPSTLIVP